MKQKKVFNIPTKKNGPLPLMNLTPLLNLLTLGYTRLENESERAFLLSICDRLWESRTLAGKCKLVFNILKVH